MIDHKLLFITPLLSATVPAYLSKDGPKNGSLLRSQMFVANVKHIPEAKKL